MSDELQPSIQSRVPWSEYLELPGISISSLKEMRRSAQHYLHRLDHPRETPALVLGRASHTAVLEPERFASQYAVWTRRSEKTGNLCPRNGQYYEAFLRENPGKEIVTEDEAQIAITIHGAVRGHSIAGAYLESGDPEVTMQWLHEGRPCRGRVDWLTQNDDGPVLVGLKTARDCRHMPFGSAAARLGYHLQWGFYHDGYAAVRGVEPRVVEIVVESEPPHAVAVYSIPEDIILQGREEYEALLRRLLECEATGEFPGPQDFEEPLTLPSWVYEQSDDISELGLL